MTDADKLLVKRAQKGDVEAFEAIYNQHLKRVYNIVWRMMGNSSDAQDVTQEVMLKAWRALPSFKMYSSIGIWVDRIAINACFDELRPHRARAVSVEQMAENGYELKSDSFEENFVTGSSIAWAIGRLQNDYRAAVVLRVRWLSKQVWMKMLPDVLK